VICTSTTRRSSTRISSGFNLHEHSSPSFGSQSGDSDSERARVEHRWVGTAGSGLSHCLGTFAFATARGYSAPKPRRQIALLGPCFKTGVSAPAEDVAEGSFRQPIPSTTHRYALSSSGRTHAESAGTSSENNHLPIRAFTLLIAGDRIGDPRRSPPKWLPSPRPTAILHDGNDAYQQNSPRPAAADLLPEGRRAAAPSARVVH